MLLFYVIAESCTVLLATGCRVEKLLVGSRYYYGDRWYGAGDRGGFGIYIGKK